MEYELVKLEQFSSDIVSVYTLLDSATGLTLFDNFIKENSGNHLSEVKEIAATILSLKKVGARHNFFKHKEGKTSDGVCALHDSKKSNLRLYCIRYGAVLVILGNGGEKLKSTRTLQETKKLEEENQLMKDLSAEIEKRRRDGDIEFSRDFLDIEGELLFNF